MRKIICLFAMLLIILTLSSGCSLLDSNPEEIEDPLPNGDELPVPEDQRETVFYVPDELGQVLVPVRVSIPWEEGIAKATLLYTREGSMPPALTTLGLAPLLPAGTDVLGLTIRDGLARVDFNEEFLQYNPDHERLIISGLVYTLTEFPTIHEVEILVEGKTPVLHSSLSIAEPLSRDIGLNLEVAAAVDDFEDTQQIVLYYLLPVGESALYVPVTRVIDKTEELLQAVVQELLNGPGPGSPLVTALPKDVALQRVSSEGNQATIDVSGDFSVVSGGQLGVDRIRHQLALTLTEIAGVANVSVLVDGAPPEFVTGIQFPETFGRPTEWNTADSTQ